MSQLDRLLQEIESARKKIVPKKSSKKKMSFIPPVVIFGAGVFLMLLEFVLEKIISISTDGVIFTIISLVIILLVLVISPIYFIVVFISRLTRSVTFDRDKFDKLNEYFKRKVIPILVKEIDPSFTYSKTGGLDMDYLYRQGVLYWKPNEGTVEDYVKGVVGETQISFCEQAIKEISLRKKEGQTRKRVEHSFRGLVIEADFNKSFQGETLLVPDIENKLTGKLLELNKRAGKEKVNLENPEFEKLFTVYGTDQVESRYIFSTSLMTRLTDLYNKMQPKAVRKKNDVERIFSSLQGDFHSEFRNFNFYILFKDNKMMMAIEWPVNYFEFDVFRSVYDEAEETREELKAITGIVEDLNLNTRIWSK